MTRLSHTVIKTYHGLKLSTIIYSRKVSVSVCITRISKLECLLPSASVEAINSSRKVVFVITEDFLESSWGTYEIEMTRMHTFREGRESMIIVILKDDIQNDKLPKALKEIWYKVVCIVWPSDPEAPYNSEKIFYKKLCTALSDGRTRISDDNTSM
ncbi:TLR3 [Mytilus coruscus]|uniref:TLR3 n=1 Tax=Mytilus coruscus TaxID=42192 RepID=A0A6J8AJR0_MYTCO|nr:TLR3 [Mytilus coruscus]